jgi:hypothetical protein
MRLLSFRLLLLFVLLSGAANAGTFSITGAGSGSFNSTDNDIFQNANGGVTGMGISFSSDMIDVTTPGLFGWNLQSAFGPASVNATSSPNFSIGTTAGNLQVTGADTLVFSATLVTGTPEPSVAALVLLGLALLGGLTFPRRRQPALAPVRRPRR